MDLDSLASVRKAAAEVASWEDVAIDVLINNAAVMAAPYSTTKDGFESQFGVGHLGHFLFTCLLLKANKIKSGGRIVNVSSGGHRLGPVRFDDPGFTVCICSAFLPFEFYLTDNMPYSTERNQIREVGCVRPSQDSEYALLNCASRTFKGPQYPFL
jgi:NAD(P)-dependent dehydrogenase (short-subunit alcohol dehydrogenase family)